MSIAIAPYTENEIPAVKDFNGRLQTGGAPPDYVFSESPISRWLPSTAGAPVYNEFYLAVEDGVVRGTYALKHQKFSFHGEIHPVVYLHHPFSEGIVNKKYAQVGVQMLRHVMRSHPVLFALGMGGYDRPLPRMLIGLNWNHCLIPFYFRVCHPARFLRNLQALRQSKHKRFLADLGVLSGAGWIGAKTLHSVKGFRGMRARRDAVVVEEFDEWADEVWQACAADFAMIAVRDSCVLRTLYPASNRNFIRLKVTAGGRLLGWVVVADVQKQNHPQYGDLRVGTILDGLSRPEDATAVIAAATHALINRNVDLITSNQSHGAWTRGLEECGFFKGPSNFIFASSKGLSEMIQPFQQTVRRIHLNRGDGDNLLQYL
jgi:hypothetical protein